jgi:AraC-like DNA-binding protein
MGCSPYIISDIVRLTFTPVRQVRSSHFEYMPNPAQIGCISRNWRPLPWQSEVSRIRVEDAKGLLLNRNHRGSQIGFEVGFQSLTHFNRAFRCIAGESPKGIPPTSSERLKSKQ